MAPLSPFVTMLLAMPRRDFIIDSGDGRSVIIAIYSKVCFAYGFVWRMAYAISLSKPSSVQ